MKLNTNLKFRNYQNKYKHIGILTLWVLLGFAGFSNSSKTDVQSMAICDAISRVSKNISIFKDPSHSLSIESVKDKIFTPFNGSIVNMGISSDVVWIRLDIINRLDKEDLYLMVGQALFDSISLFSISNQKIERADLGRFTYFKNRFVKTHNYIFPITLPLDVESQLYLRISSSDPIHMPLSIGRRHCILEQVSVQNLIFGIYLGIIVIMIFYNLFIFFTVKDISYIYYILFIFFVGLTQADLKGYSFQFLWPTNLFLAKYSTVIIPTISGVTTGLFMKNFLQTKTATPKLDKGITVFISCYILIGIIGLTIGKQTGMFLLQIVAFVGSLFALLVGWMVMNGGFRAGRFFLIAYIFFLFSVVVFVLSNFNFLPQNNFTSNVLEIGSALQILLLSFALADKINTYKKEEERSKKLALATSLENQRLVKEQNVTLEMQVNERTQELRKANDSLTSTLSQLKKTQSKLVESEKMVSLGQLTAGIAHEINNPINFVTSNIKPLELNVLDLLNIIDKYEKVDASQNIEEQINAIDAYKKKIDLAYINEEIKTLLAGIKDGAQRTAEIVSSLKNFARIDEANIKFVNLNEGILSTLLLVRNSFPKNFTIIKELGNIPEVECNPGKINQVFMNIITNGLQSIVERQATNPDLGILKIKTFEENGMVRVSIKDNGMGIKEDVRDKIFEPFYTTKPVGQGTGLGMSIVKGIIDSHKGTIEVISNFGEGAEFIINLPVDYLS